LETMGGVFTKIIDRNTAIPTTKSQIFTTAADNQPQVEIVVLQGERAMAADNVKLGSFTLDGIPPAPRGIPKIEVAFNMDVNGILNVTAKDMATNKEQHITIESSRLTDEEIERMKNDAEANEEADRRKKELIEARNEIESLSYNAEKLLKDLGDKVTVEEKGRIEGEISEARRAQEGEDVEAIRSVAEKLTKSLQELSTRLYAQQAEAGGNPTDQSDDASGETVDAEFKDSTQA
ncbi:MAG: Hsp70 family protein, partial [Synergistales bacterium]|nr:Hsp70 family protein [Synergistales bacterium]